MRRQVPRLSFVVLSCALALLLLLAHSSDWYRDSTKDSSIRRFPDYSNLTLPDISPTWRNDSIPRHIHQVTFTRDDEMLWPASWPVCMESWRKKHEDFEYHLWTLKDAEKLIATRFPNFLSIFQGFRLNISRDDFVRPFILYEFGGIYADLDVRCNERFYEQLPKGVAAVAQSPHPWEKYQNCLMAAPARHPFFHQVILVIVERSRKQLSDNDYFGIARQTGPGAIDEAEKRHTGVLLLPSSEYSALNATKASHLGTTNWQVPKKKKESRGFLGFM